MTRTVCLNATFAIKLYYYFLSVYVCRLACLLCFICRVWNKQVPAILCLASCMNRIRKAVSLFVFTGKVRHTGDNIRHWTETIISKSVKSSKRFYFFYADECVCVCVCSPDSVLNKCTGKINIQNTGAV